jgi:hypothetical protein
VKAQQQILRLRVRPPQERGGKGKSERSAQDDNLNSMMR